MAVSRLTASPKTPSDAALNQEPVPQGMHDINKTKGGFGNDANSVYVGP